jgi:transposase
LADRNNGRRFLEGGWIARSGTQWRDLPEEFGKWNSVYRRFRDWGIAGVFECIFNALSEDPDMEMAVIDGTTIKVQHHGHDSKRGGAQSQAIGKSKGG